MRINDLRKQNGGWFSEDILYKKRSKLIAKDISREWKYTKNFQIYIIHPLFARTKMNLYLQKNLFINEYKYFYINNISIAKLMYKYT